ncbi:beta-L-arabinofuranosidase domain-containing protein [Rheinheimera riviphila]|uniref:beta-L-arabinofuranosidase domain-containing protein n=1 Tax=Rheinheimera riviphila TaxID=1834037 RepID=UPI00197DE41F|nr:beta-L-arabinofuranosidase domain-containing protein [Rheinheimera riviphila]
MASTSISYFPLQQVKLTTGPFADAQQLNVQYLLALEPDRLLAPYLREAGLATKAEPYGNWESSGLDGHIGGHYLSALSLAVAATGDAELHRRLRYMLSELRRAQLQMSTDPQLKGYLGGVPQSRKLWAQIQQGDIRAELFSLNQAWVPLYNLHKVFAGLHDAYQFGGEPLAKTMLLDYGDWLKRLVSKLTPAQIQQMLIAEPGGINESLVDVYQLSGDQAYLELAKQFSQQSLLEPLLKQQDKLNGLHANTQIPKVIGFWRVGQAGGNGVGNSDWQQAADFFWRTVTEKRTVAIGGNSVREHFHDAADFQPMVEDAEGPETCNSYNMLKLSKLLFSQSGDVKYLNYYERTSYNHILSSQHPKHGGLVYFTSMRPGHYRTYSSVQDSMWCCVGSGIENHSKYAELIYARDGDELLLNLFIPSTLDWPERGLQLQLATEFPDANGVTLRVTKAAASLQTLSIREPDWLQGQPLQLLLNGKPLTVTRSRPGYLSVTQPFSAGDEIQFELKPQLTLEPLPGRTAEQHQYVAALYGPVVLASAVQPLGKETLQFVAGDGRMGHIADGPQCPPEAAPLLVGESAEFLAGLQRVPGVPLAFSVNAPVKNPGAQPLTLMPFFRLHDSRYQLYWQQMTKAEYPGFIEKAQQQQQAAAKLTALTLDQINPGEQQPEVEHQYQGEQSRAGMHLGRHWRDSTAWFGYQLADVAPVANGSPLRVLRVDYFAGDVGRSFSIWLNGKKLADVSLPVSQQLRQPGSADFYSVDYLIPPEVLALSSNGKHQLKFVADPGSVAGGIYGIRLMRQEPEK